MKGKDMDLMNELLDCLSGIDYSIFDEGYLNELLDSRDSEPFDTQWCRVDDEIKALKNGKNYTDEMGEEQNKVREKAFIIIEQNLESELSEYVSDDFGLIYDSLVLDYKDEWLTKLIKTYQSKKIPSGAL